MQEEKIRLSKDESLAYLTNLFKDEVELEIICRLYLELREYSKVEQHHNLQPQTFDRLFATSQGTEERFLSVLAKCSLKDTKKIIFVELPRTVRAIADVACHIDYEALSDPGTATKLKACAILTQFASKSGIVSPQKIDPMVDDDELSKLWKEIEKENKKD